MKPKRPRMLHAACCVAIAALTPIYVNAQSDANGWTTAGLTKELAIIGADEQTVSMRNTSERTIIVFNVFFYLPNGDTHGRTLDYSLAPTDEGLKPGDTYAIFFGPGELRKSRDHVLHIDAVLYSDGDARGQPDLISHFQMRRLGNILESERILHILSDLTAESDISKVRDKIGHLPNSFEEARRDVDGSYIKELPPELLSFKSVSEKSGFLSGVQFAREKIGFELDQLSRLATLADSRKKSEILIAYLKSRYAAGSMNQRSYILKMKKGGQ